jgi:hypothetical protein
VKPVQMIMDAIRDVPARAISCLICLAAPVPRLLQPARQLYAQLRARAKGLREGLAAVAEMIVAERSTTRRKELKHFRAVSQAKLDEIEDALS